MKIDTGINLDVVRFKQLIDQIEHHKQKIAEERDTLDDLHGELVQLIDSMNSGIENLETGIELIRYGVDDISQYV